jgi:hypothetical protein
LVSIATVLSRCWMPRSYDCVVASLFSFRTKDSAMSLMSAISCGRVSSNGLVPLALNASTHAMPESRSHLPRATGRGFLTMRKDFGVPRT